MLQKGAILRLFAFKTSFLRIRFGFAPYLLRSSLFCYICIRDGTHLGLSHPQ